MTHSPQPASSDTEPPVPQPVPSGPRNLRTRLLDLFVTTATVLEAAPIAARMRRFRLGGEALGSLKFVPGQQLRILTGTEGRVGDPRTYSVWHFDPAAAVLDLCVLDHGEGPGSRWGRAVEVGDQVRFRGPTGSFTLRADAPYHLFAGEETAAVAFGAMLAALPDDAPVYGAVETATAADRLPLPRAADLSHPLRGTASAASSQVLVDAVRDLRLPDAPGVAYLAGEARTIQSLRRHLVEERGWPRKSVVMKPFWTPGKKGLE